MTKVHFSRAIRMIMVMPKGRATALRLWNRVAWIRGEVDARTEFGALMRCDAHDIIQASIIHFGVWEPVLSTALRELAKPGDVVVDIGANIGYFTLLLAKSVGPTGTVVAIEAMPKIADRMRFHVDRNGLSNVRLVQAAITTAVMPVTMFAGPDTNTGASTARADYGYAATCVVEGKPLSMILSETERKSVTVIKCDIEGAELPIMAQLLDELDDYPQLRAVAVEANAADQPEWSKLFDRFVSLGFRPHQLPTEIAETWAKSLRGEVPETPIAVSALPSGTSDLLFVRER